MIKQIQRRLRANANERNRENKSEIRRQGERDKESRTSTRDSNWGSKSRAQRTVHHSANVCVVFSLSSTVLKWREETGSSGFRTKRNGGVAKPVLHRINCLSFVFLAFLKVPVLPGPWCASCGCQGAYERAKQL